MKPLSRWISVVSLLVAAQISSAQQQNDGRFITRDGYDRADFGTRVLTIKTRSGNKSLRVSVSKLRMAESRKTVAIRLPQQGTALLQHAAGTANVSVGNERFSPLEGEWLRLTLPTNLRVGIEDDTILMDLIVIEDAPAGQR
jgi:hypothetical protein